MITRPDKRWLQSHSETDAVRWILHLLRFNIHGGRNAMRLRSPAYFLSWSVFKSFVFGALGFPNFFETETENTHIQHTRRKTTHEQRLLPFCVNFSLGCSGSRDYYDPPLAHAKTPTGNRVKGKHAWRRTLTATRDAAIRSRTLPIAFPEQEQRNAKELVIRPVLLAAYEQEAGSLNWLLLNFPGNVMWTQITMRLCCVTHSEKTNDVARRSLNRAYKK